MSFGRQKNLVRRAYRPDSRSLRDARRRGVGKASLLDVLSGGDAAPRVSLMSRIFGPLARLFGRGR